MKLPSVHTNMLDDRSKQVLHFEREPGTKSYKLFDPNSGHIHVNRDVIFKEHENWEWETAINNSVQVTDQFIVENYTADTPNHSDHPKISENEFATSTPPSTPLSTHQTLEYDTNNQSGRKDTASSGTSSNNNDPKYFRLASYRNL